MEKIKTILNRWSLKDCQRRLNSKDKKDERRNDKKSIKG